MTDPVRRALTVIVNLPDEIDLNNADDVHAKLVAANAVDTVVVVADLTSTTFCDTAGIRALVLAQRDATKAGAELRLVVPPGAVLRAMELHGLTDPLRPHPTLDEALAS